MHSIRLYLVQLKGVVEQRPGNQTTRNGWSLQVWKGLSGSCFNLTSGVSCLFLRGVSLKHEPLERVQVLDGPYRIAVLELLNRFVVALVLFRVLTLGVPPVISVVLLQLVVEVDWPFDVLADFW